MNVRVDVLGELRRVIADERGWGDREDAERVGAVYEVVAELIDVFRELREHAQHHPDCSIVPNGIDGDCWCGLIGSAERADAVLARIGAD